MDSVAAQELQNKQKVAGSFLTDAEASQCLSAAVLSLYANPYPTAHARDLPDSHVCRGPTHWQLLWSSRLQAACFCGSKGASSRRLPQQGSQPSMASFSSNMLAVQRKPRQLANRSNVMGKHDLRTN